MLSRLSIIFLLYFIFPSNTYGQREDRIWYFGCYPSVAYHAGAGLDFNSGVPVVLLNSAMGCTEGSATQCNRKGELLFYTNGVRIWNKTHAIMGNSTSLGGHVSAEQAALIIPFPGDTLKYYVFAQNGFPTCPGIGLHYSVVDMRLNNGLGDVDSIKAVLLQPSTSEWLAGSKHTNGIDFWVVTSSYDSCVFYSYKVTANGVSMPIKSDLGYHSNSTFKLDFNTKGNKVSYKALPTDTSIYFTRYIADFDQNTGMFSNPISLGVNTANTASCFSPNDSLLYAVVYDHNAVTLSLYQYDMYSQNIYASRQLIKVFSDAPHIDMKLGPDGKIYATSSSLDSLDIIHAPNLVGPACNYHEKALYLGGRSVRYILPNKTFAHSYPSTTGSFDYSLGLSEISPNPATNYINISSQQQIQSLELTNITGQVLLNKAINQKEYQLQLSDFSEGIYFVKVIYPSGLRVTRKVVVSH